MPRPIFISYSRRTARTHAERLHHALDGAQGPAFLDTADIEAGDLFPRALGEAVLNSRVVVVFVDDAYFKRWYCLRELQLALSPFEALWRKPSASDTERGNALAHIVIALPEGGDLCAMEHLPPLLRTSDWPLASQTQRLADLIKTRLGRCLETVNEKWQSSAAAASPLTTLLQEAAIPPPGNLAGLPIFPLEIAPSLASRFVGRADDLWRIHFTLCTVRGDAANAAALSGSLEGTGGSGKTQLAIEYIWRFGPGSYPGGIFWIDADVPDERVTERFHGILQALDEKTPDLAAFLERGRNATRELARALQNLPADRPVLFVVDNVPEPPPGTSPKPLRTWCPAIGRVTVLATSRLTLSLDPQVRALPVPTLLPEDGVDLLTLDVTRARLDEPSWRRIADWVGCLPLALRLLNRAMVAGALDPSDLLHRMDQAPATEELDRQAELLRDHVPAGVLRGVTDAFAVSYERLSEPQQRAVRLLAQLAPDPIPEHLLDAFGDLLPSAVRAALRARSWMTPLESGTGRLFAQMHRLLADFARTRTVDPEGELDRVAQALLRVLPAAESGNPESWPTMAACVPHANLVFDSLARRDVPALQGKAAELGLHLSGFLHSQGQSDPALTIVRSAALAERVLGGEHPTTLASLAMLGVILRTRGELTEARDVQRRVLAAHQRLSGDEDPGTLSAMNNLALTLQQLGDLAAARTLHERGLDLSPRVFGDGHPLTLTSMSNLAETLYAQGEFGGARRLHEQVLAIRRRVVGNAHRSTLQSLHNLAMTLQGQGDVKRARSLLDESVAGRRALLGDEHPDTLGSMAGLAQLLQSEGDFGGARTLQAHVLAIQRRVLGDNHPSTLSCASNLAVTLAAQGDLQAARTLEEEVLTRRRRVWGDTHPDTVTAMANLGTTLQAMGHLNEARTLHERVLTARGHELGEEHPETLTAMNNVAGIMFLLGELAPARALQERVTAGRQQALGDEHPDTLASVGNLTLMLYKLGEFHSAYKLGAPALATSERVLGLEHPATLTMMSTMALLVREGGDLPTAFTLQQRVVDGRRRLLGEEHPDTLIAMSNLALTLEDLDDRDGARQLQERVVDLARRIHGETHPSTLTAMNNLALNVLASGAVLEACAMLEQILAARRRDLGREHPDTLTTMHNLAVARHRQDERAAARALLEQVVAGRTRVLGADHPDTRTAVADLEAL